MPSWWEEPLRILQTNLRLTDGALDGAAITQEAIDFGANALLINAGGIYAFYPTNIPFHRRSPFLRGDLLGDAIRACHAAGIHVIVRYDLSGLHRDAYEAHPEWFYRSAAGRPMVDKGLYITCPNGPYYRQQFFVLWDELTSRYQVDGLFFNAFGHKERDREGVYYGPCYCEACKQLFRERTGRDLPARLEPGSPEMGLHAAFRAETLTELARSIYRYVKERDPHIAVFSGAGARAILDGYADAAAIELHAAPSGALTGPRWRHAAGESCRWIRTLGSGYASCINAVYCHVGPGVWRLVAAPAGWLTHTLAQTIANGGWPYMMCIGTPATQEDKSALPAVRELFHFARDHAEYYHHLESLSPIVVVWPSASISDGVRWHGVERSAHHYRGWYRVLVEQHYLFDVISDTQLDRAGAAELLQQYRLVILPNVVRLSREACTALDAYVQGGGTLLATAATSLEDADGTPRTNLGLQCLGASRLLAAREGFRNAYFRIEGSSAWPGLEGVHVLPVQGTYLYPEPRDGASGELRFIAPELYGAPEQTLIEHETEWPAVIWYTYGHGQTAYLPWEPGRIWYESAPASLERFMAGVVTRLLPEPQPVDTDAPASVELTAFRQRAQGSHPERYIIHVVNGTGEDGPAVRPPVPLYTIQVRVRAERALRVRAIRLGQELPVQREGVWQATVLPRLDQLELLVWE
jgi:hypothetical protein